MDLKVIREYLKG